MSEKKKPSILFPAILIGVVLFLLAGYAALIAFSPKAEQKTAENAIATEANTETTTQVSEPTAPQMPVLGASEPNLSNVDAMMMEQKIGDDNAPIKVTEYSSLTCGHCAAFHNNVLPRLKTDYVDTGKVQFIFKEFPLNKPAVDASKLLRCLPRERFETFMGLLFAEQKKWAFVEDYLTPLKQNAKLAGLSDDDVTACLNNKELETRIMTEMQSGGEKYKIQSTPSFIINSGETILVGDQPYEVFKETFDKLLPPHKDAAVTQ